MAPSAVKSEEVSRLREVSRAERSLSVSESWTEAREVEGRVSWWRPKETSSDRVVKVSRDC